MVTLLVLPAVGLAGAADTTNLLAGSRSHSDRCAGARDRGRGVTRGDGLRAGLIQRRCYRGFAIDERYGRETRAA